MDQPDITKPRSMRFDSLSVHAVRLKSAKELLEYAFRKPGVRRQAFSAFEVALQGARTLGLTAALRRISRLSLRNHSPSNLGAVATASKEVLDTAGVNSIVLALEHLEEARHWCAGFSALPSQHLFPCRASRAPCGSIQLYHVDVSWEQQERGLCWRGKAMNGTPQGRLGSDPQVGERANRVMQAGRAQCHAF